jgi:hypothetical protein
MSKNTQLRPVSNFSKSESRLLGDGGVSVVKNLSNGEVQFEGFCVHTGHVAPAMSTVRITRLTSCSCAQRAPWLIRP